MPARFFSQKIGTLSTSFAIFSTAQAFAQVTGATLRECSQRGKPQPKSVPRIARMGHSRNSRQKNLRKNPRNPPLVVQNGQISRSPSKRGLKPACGSLPQFPARVVIFGFRQKNVLVSETGVP